MSRSDSIYINSLTDRNKKAYKESLKVYRVNYAIAETKRNESKAEEIAEGMAWIKYGNI